MTGDCSLDTCPVCPGWAGLGWAGLGWAGLGSPLHSSTKHSGSWFIVKFLFHHVVGCVVCINHFAVNKVTVRH